MTFPNEMIDVNIWQCKKTQLKLALCCEIFLMLIQNIGLWVLLPPPRVTYREFQTEQWLSQAVTSDEVRNRREHRLNPCLSGAMEHLAIRSPDNTNPASS